MEVRRLKIEIRANKAIIEGYVNATERDSRVLPRSMSPRATTDFVERVKSKTFEKALEARSNIDVKFNHSRVLGGVSQGNLELYEDNIGLYARATISDAEVIEKAKNKELRGWSFGFVSKSEDWGVASDGVQRRTLEDIELREVSILTETPAYIATSIEMRGENCEVLEQRGIEETPEITVIEEEKQKPVDYTMQDKELELIKLKRR